MISFIVAVVLLILGYLLYGKFVEKVFGVNAEAVTPAIAKSDGVDYVPMKPWRIFLVQFLNIAGLGPVFGAIMGIFYGPAAYIWIVFGSIFAGGVHDYLSGMMSARMGGMSLPDITGGQLGNGFKKFMILLSMILLVLLATSFLSGVATLLQNLLPLQEWYLAGVSRPAVWLLMVFAYYVLATVLPVDKLIGKFYPVFGLVLLIMGIGVVTVMLGAHAQSVPEVFDGLQNRSGNGLPMFPMMFVSIACGAISGFHGTQSPLMARCITSEKQGRTIFYGAMICEGILALIWAAAAGTFFADPGNGLYGIDGLRNFAAQHPGENIAALVVDKVCKSWLGVIGGALALIGVIAAPVTSGDTALRSARLIVADAIGLEQKKISHRLIISIPMFVIVFILIFVDFNSIWRYFSWTNQMLATFTLWAGALFLRRQERDIKPVGPRNGYLIALIPAVFMTMVSASYIFIAPEGFKFAARGISNISYLIAASVTLLCLFSFYKFGCKKQQNP